MEAGSGCTLPGCYDYCHHQVVGSAPRTGQELVSCWQLVWTFGRGQSSDTEHRIHHCDLFLLSSIFGGSVDPLD